MLAFALQQVKTKYRTGMTQARGYLPHVVMFGQSKHWVQITARLNNLEGSENFACACVCVEIRFHLGCACVTSEKQALALTNVDG